MHDQNLFENLYHLWAEVLSTLLLKLEAKPRMGGFHKLLNLQTAESQTYMRLVRICEEFKGNFLAGAKNEQQNLFNQTWLFLPSLLTLVITKELTKVFRDCEKTSLNVLIESFEVLTGQLGVDRLSALHLILQLIQFNWCKIFFYFFANISDTVSSTFLRCAIFGWFSCVSVSISCVLVFIKVVA